MIFSVILDQNEILYSFQVDDVLINALKANMTKVNVTDVEQFYIDTQQSDLYKNVMQQIDSLLSQRLEPERKDRIMTFIRGFQVGTTSKEITDALVR